MTPVIFGDPKNDFVFHCVFGTEDHKSALIAFLNDVLELDQAHRIHWRLYGQHTAETGQVFTPEAIDQAYELTNGQAWLLNALAREIVEDFVPDPAVSITVEYVTQAKDVLVRRQDTHLDSLGERLQEARVRRVIEPIMVGEPFAVRAS